jgi:hypothetical protein
MDWTKRDVRFRQELSAGSPAARARRAFRTGIPQAGKDWDAHDLPGNHTRMAAEYDEPAAALLKDLDARGLLQDTLVMGVTEFGRTPVAQGSGKRGRDHHPGTSPADGGRGRETRVRLRSRDEVGHTRREPGVGLRSPRHRAASAGARPWRSFYHNGIRRV